VSRSTPLSRRQPQVPNRRIAPALGEGRSGSRYLVTIPRRGYLFVAPVTIAEETASEAPLAAETRRQDNLPVRLTRLIRGAVTVSSLVGQVLR
jgi:DNA-binding winged helix-turn-helix (wHTH) protein